MPALRKRRDKRCKHGLVICAKDECLIITDAAKRIHDATSLAVLHGDPMATRRGWMAFALQDGTTDHVVYPSKADAISHMSDEFRFAYVCLANCMGGMPAKDAQIWLDLHRHVYKQGGRLTDPNQSFIMPLGREQRITRPL
jgi:hypothetical protein